MRKIKTNPKICESCIYHMGFGSQPGKEQTEGCINSNVACNYLGIKGESRIFKEGKLRYKPEYCDKYILGESITGTWTSDSMHSWKMEADKREEWKELRNDETY